MFYDCAAKSSLPQKIIIATDDKRIAQNGKSFGAKIVMTSPDHPSGTDRLAEAANLLKLSPTDIIVNVQGDMAYFHPEIVTQVAEPLLNNAFFAYDYFSSGNYGPF
ncbi:MAG: 3-deoxy-manno-octulosonate cytidylyltransferase [Candidatus Methanoperedenaceae archaeon GB50]|nr:MAG: 3-deoxy-manno-octulosonate cytidylyltransferase [Candidatus Methanoperedenaceae archaeon GB50]